MQADTPTWGPLSYILCAVAFGLLVYAVVAIRQAVALARHRRLRTAFEALVRELQGRVDAARIAVAQHKRAVEQFTERNAELDRQAQRWAERGALLYTEDPDYLAAPVKDQLEGLIEAQRELQQSLNKLTEAGVSGSRDQLEAELAHVGEDIDEARAELKRLGALSRWLTAHEAMRGWREALAPLGSLLAAGDDDELDECLERALDGLAGAVESAESMAVAGAEAGELPAEMTTLGQAASAMRAEFSAQSSLVASMTARGVAVTPEAQRALAASRVEGWSLICGVLHLEVALVDPLIATREELEQGRDIEPPGDSSHRDEQYRRLPDHLWLCCAAALKGALHRGEQALDEDTTAAGEELIAAAVGSAIERGRATASWLVDGLPPAPDGPESIPEAHELWLGDHSAVPAALTSSESVARHAATGAAWTLAAGLCVGIAMRAPQLPKFDFGGGDDAQVDSADAATHDAGPEDPSGKPVYPYVYTVGSRWLYRYTKTAPPGGPDTSPTQRYFITRAVTDAGATQDESGEQVWAMTMRQRGGSSRRIIDIRQRVGSDCIYDYLPRTSSWHRMACREPQLETLELNGRTYYTYATHSQSHDGRRVTHLDPRVGVVREVFTTTAGREYKMELAGFAVGDQQHGEFDKIPIYCNWDHAKVLRRSGRESAPLTGSQGFAEVRARRAGNRGWVSIVKHGAADVTMSKNTRVTQFKVFALPDGSAEYVAVRFEADREVTVRIFRLQDGHARFSTFRVPRANKFQDVQMLMLADETGCYMQLRWQDRGPQSPADDYVRPRKILDLDFSADQVVVARGGATLRHR